MNIRTHQAGDEALQAAIYNETAADLPKFKPATAADVQRRTRARNFDPTTHFFAVEQNRPVAYCHFHPSGRLSFPWCKKGFEQVGEPLFNEVLAAMKARGQKRAFAAYRADWPTVRDFFLRQGFLQVREMVNFVIELTDLPTVPARPSNVISPLQRGDVPDILTMMPEVLRVTTAQALEEHLFRNPYFGPESAFVIRSRFGEAPMAVGLLITETTYADPRQVDAAMPCFWVGAFGSEGLPAKRIKGLFSFLVRQDQNISALGLDLIGYAMHRLANTEDIETLACQIPSDVPALLKFFTRYCRKQGSFPVWQKDLC